MIDEETPLIEFTANDRCDRCRAQAYYLARHTQFGELMFCIHDARKHESALLDEGWEIIQDYAAIEALMPKNYDRVDA